MVLVFQKNPFATINWGPVHIESMTKKAQHLPKRFSGDPTENSYAAPANLSRSKLLRELLVFELSFTCPLRVHQPEFASRGKHA